MDHRSHDIVAGLLRPAFLDDRRAVRPGDPAPSPSPSGTTDGSVRSDLTYFLVLGGMALGRWTEFQSGQPLTATGEPATPAHLRRYLPGLSTLGLGIWIAANVLGNAAIHFMG